eukprot:TRINITY_DN23888_c0_g1_i2.p1 TRINITY_DN23888_c0_g1~~TRINITY_DN23888_c0_g1_i2.p1  ORF type:complete len:337 (+),score=124.63 TRINITY_DN23888_c0_g1_i2:41-1051(+)
MKTHTPTDGTPLLQTMSKSKSDLRDIMSAVVLEKESTDVYRTDKLYLPYPFARAAAGGQLLSLCLAAAKDTVKPELVCHALQMTFLDAAKVGLPATFHVTRTRDGRNFGSRSVTAKQEGRTVLTAIVSFHKPEESTLVHQHPMPAVPQPDDCMTPKQYIESLLEEPAAAKNKMRRMLLKKEISLFDEMKFAFETRPTDPRDGPWLPVNPRASREPEVNFWMRSTTQVPQELFAQQVFGLYASDQATLAPVGKPCGVLPTDFSLMVTLNHSIWFHTAFDPNDWFLLHLKSTRANAGRALVNGQLFTSDGKLAVSFTQEGATRMVNPAIAIPSKTAKL